MSTTRGAHFSPKLFAYLRELKANNEKEWFDTNRDRYEALLVEPAIQFILDAGPHLKKVSPHFRADPRKNGGSLFRIYNDRRFKPDAPPYKTHVGIQFRHDRGRTHTRRGSTSTSSRAGASSGSDRGGRSRRR